jgi:hypothetical protein
MQQTGIAMQHVQYKGGSPATTDLMAGTIDAHMMSSAVGAGQAENPKLKMLAVASTRRLPSIPNVPTMAEAGVPGVDLTSWLCVFGPPGCRRGARADRAETRRHRARAGLPGEIPRHRFRAARPRRRSDRRMYRDEVTRWTRVHQGARLSENAR